MKHLNVMAKVMLATGLIVAYGYSIEAFMRGTAATTTKRFMLVNRMTGPYWLSYWADSHERLIPHCSGSSASGQRAGALGLSIVINVGMWLASAS